MDTRRSVWAEMTFFKVILCWLIVPVIVAVVVAKSYKVNITEKTMTIKSGVFNINNHEYAVAGITEMNVYQSLWGRIFNYGSVNIALAGNKHVSLTGIINPNGIKAFVESQLEKTADAKHMLVN